MLSLSIAFQRCLIAIIVPGYWYFFWDLSAFHVIDFNRAGYSFLSYFIIATTPLTSIGAVDLFDMFSISFF
jgi:hypothetical protein